MPTPSCLLPLVAAGLLAGCLEPVAEPEDAAVAAAEDAALPPPGPDASLDAGADAGAEDASPPDAGAPDAGPRLDAGPCCVEVWGLEPGGGPTPFCSGPAQPDALPAAWLAQGSTLLTASGNKGALDAVLWVDAVGSAARPRLTLSRPDGCEATNDAKNGLATLDHWPEVGGRASGRFQGTLEPVPSPGCANTRYSVNGSFCAVRQPDAE